MHRDSSASQLIGECLLGNKLRTRCAQQQHHPSASFRAPHTKDSSALVFADRQRCAVNVLLVAFPSGIGPGARAIAVLCWGLISRRLIETGQENIWRKGGETWWCHFRKNCTCNLVQSHRV
uniref:Uncharacterized protein n=1 Tax=Ascaris lumbricoides TaxID=6252 RepID=A0A0M3HRU7_ASCLU